MKGLHGLRRGRWAGAAVMAVMVFGATAAYGVQNDESFSGSTTPGSHEWIQDLEGSQFCGRCHSGIAADLLTGPHSREQLSSCTICHPPTFDVGGGHAAQTARCADCHGYSSPGEPHAAPGLNCDTCHAVHGPLFGGAVEQLKHDAHNGMREDLGELDDAEVSKTCIACHTHIRVNLNVVQRGPLELRVGS